MNERREIGDQPFLIQIIGIIASYAVLPGLGYLYFATGYSPTAAFLCIPSILAATWLGGLWTGVANVIAATASLLFAGIVTGHFPIGHPAVFLDRLLRAEILFSMPVLVSLLGKSLKRERKAARVDHLTGALNLRTFTDVLENEIERSRRYDRELALAYLDFDNFKAVNDEYGHRVGDELLQVAIGAIGSILRKNDRIGRLGGDEFAVLLPECGQEDARHVVGKVQERILREMEAHRWPVTSSVGTVICRSASHTPAELIEMADTLMYSAKRLGKNRSAFSVVAQDGLHQTPG